jgi:hypothetical protein
MIVTPGRLGRLEASLLNVPVQAAERQAGWRCGCTTTTTVAEVRAALEQFPRRFAAKEMELHRIEAGVLPGNDASARVLQKLGFRTGGRFSGLAHIS